MNARRWASLGISLALLACGVDSNSVAAIEGGAGEAGNGVAGGAAGAIAGGRGGGGPGGASAAGGGVAEGGNAGSSAAGKAGAAGKGSAGNGGAAGATAGTDVGGASGDAGEGGSGGSNAGTAGQAGDAGQAGSGDAGESGAGQAGAGPGGAGPGGAGPGGAGQGGTAVGTAGQGGTSSGPRCGDGLVNQPGEECDDGNAVEGDACSSTCKVFCPSGGKLVPETHRCFFLSATKGDAYFPEGTVPDPCTGIGVHVAMLSHPDDAYQVRQGLAFDDAWVGARTYDDEGSDDPSRYRWFEGPTLKDATWRPNEPTDFNASRCVAFKKDGGDVSYENASCGEDHLTLCVREPVCFVGGRYGIVDGTGHCFVTHPEPLDRAAAATVCSSTYGGHLATFGKPEELALLGGLGFQNNWVEAIQTTGSKEPDQGWTWPSDNNAPLASDSSMWSADRPDDGGDLDPPVKENCAILTRGRYLDDRACSAARPALCEVP